LGSTANKTLHVESGINAADWDQLTFTPNGVVSFLGDILIAGATNPKHLVVGSEGALAEVLTDLAATPTSAGDMTNVSSLWGNIISLINDTTAGLPVNLMYYGTNIGSLASDQAITVAPTTTLTNIPGGGTSLGAESLLNEPLRAHWVWPLANRTTSYLNDDAALNPNPVQIVSTDMRGRDPWFAQVPVARVYFPTMWNRQITFTDGAQSYVYMGDGRSRRLASPVDGEVDSEVKQQVVQYGTHGSQLLSYVAKIDNNGGSSAITLALKRYIPDFDSWVQCSDNEATGGTFAYGGNPYLLGINTIAYSPTMGVSKTTGNLHAITNGGQHWYQFLEPPGQDSFTHFRRTGSVSVGGQAYNSTGVWRSPDWLLPFGGAPCVASEIIFEGDLEAGGTSSTAKVDIGTQTQRALAFNSNATGSSTRTFVQGTKRFGHHAYLPDNMEAFDLFGVQVTLTRGSTTQKTPNGVPITIRGIANLDGVIRRPREVLGEMWNRT